MNDAIANANERAPHQEGGGLPWREKKQGDDGEAAHHVDGCDGAETPLEQRQGGQHAGAGEGVGRPDGENRRYTEGDHGGKVSPGLGGRGETFAGPEEAIPGAATEDDGNMQKRGDTAQGGGADEPRIAGSKLGKRIHGAGSVQVGGTGWGRRRTECRENTAGR